MAKKGMNLRYKRKRQRNKYVDPSDNNPLKSFGISALSVLLFLGVMYLLVLGMKELKVFQRGYTKGESTTDVDYVNIPIGTVFTRDDKEYLVLFDDYSGKTTSDPYINTIISNQETRVYKVDMSKSENAKYKGEKANTKASKSSELSISDITLIKIVNGRLTEYLSGKESIEGYLNK